MKLGFAEPKRQHTKSFERYVMELLQFMTPQDVLLHLGISWDVANDIQKRRLGKRFARPKLKRLKEIAIDEIYLGKKHKYITLVLDLESGAVVFVGDGKGADALKPFWKRLKSSGAKNKAVPPPGDRRANGTHFGAEMAAAQRFLFKTTGSVPRFR